MLCYFYSYLLFMSFFLKRFCQLFDTNMKQCHLAVCACISFYFFLGKQIFRKKSKLSYNEMLAHFFKIDFVTCVVFLRERATKQFFWKKSLLRKCYCCCSSWERYLGYSFVVNPVRNFPLFHYSVNWKIIVF